MTNNITARKATLDDVDAIVEIYNESISAGGITWERECIKNGYVICKMVRFHKHESYFVLVEDDEILGWGSIEKHYDYRDKYPDCCETAVMLHHNLIGHGYGKHLQQALLEHCRAWHYQHAIVKIFDTNTSSIAFHRKFNYEVVGKEWAMNDLTSDSSQMTVIMHLALK
ncbi:MAG: hypothetical protein B6242_01490 [Anaerolineaceae bacterium 4572_78]|nr:MAG: hypothetical protein B6242_01490 [Anaerolineaceae bacterium 4572_78]